MALWTLNRLTHEGGPVRRTIEFTALLAEKGDSQTLFVAEKQVYLVAEAPRVEFGGSFNGWGGGEGHGVNMVKGCFLFEEDEDKLGLEYNAWINCAPYVLLHSLRTKTICKLSYSACSLQMEHTELKEHPC